jgi:hypothetical protein
LPRSNHLDFFEGQIKYPLWYDPGAKRRVCLDKLRFMALFDWPHAHQSSRSMCERSNWIFT